MAEIDPRIQLGAIKTESRFENANRADSESKDYDFTFLRSISPTSEVGIGGTRRDLSFTGATDGLERNNLFVRYQKELASAV